MQANLALSSLLTLLFALLPIALYCLMLSSINRRAEPLLVSGAWDFAGLLFAASGILLWAGPAMLVAWHERSLAGESPRSFAEIWQQWWLLWSAYFGVLLIGALTLLWLRRQTTAIYNVQTDQVPAQVAATLQRLGFDFAQNAYQQFLIAPAKSIVPAQASEAVSAVPLLPDSGGSGTNVVSPLYSAAIEIESFRPLCHTTLHWYETAPHVRREIEEELRRQLAGARAVDNAASVWQFGIGILLFAAIFLSVFFYVLASILTRRI